MADRYMYLPQAGLFVAAVWGTGEGLSRLRHGRRLAWGMSLAVLAALAAGTWVQLGYWRNEETLFRRALVVT
jgi:hypothetical protein